MAPSAVEVGVRARLPTAAPESSRPQAFPATSVRVVAGWGEVAWVAEGVAWEPVLGIDLAYVEEISLFDVNAAHNDCHQCYQFHCCNYAIGAMTKSMSD